MSTQASINRLAARAAKHEQILRDLRSLPEDAKIPEGASATDLVRLARETRQARLARETEQKEERAGAGSGRE